MNKNRGCYNTDFEAICGHLLLETSPYKRVPFNNKSRHIYRDFVAALLIELGRTIHIAMVQFSRPLDTTFKEDFCVGFVR